jgi:hypothetical protein
MMLTGMEMAAATGGLADVWEVMGKGLAVIFSVVAILRFFLRPFWEWLIVGTVERCASRVWGAIVRYIEHEKVGQATFDQITNASRERQVPELERLLRERVFAVELKARRDDDEKLRQALNLAQANKDSLEFVTASLTRLGESVTELSHLGPTLKAIVDSSRETTRVLEALRTEITHQGREVGRLSGIVEAERYSGPERRRVPREPRDVRDVRDSDDSQ